MYVTQHVSYLFFVINHNGTSPHGNYTSKLFLQPLHSFRQRIVALCLKIAVISFGYMHIGCKALAHKLCAIGCIIVF